MGLPEGAIRQKMTQNGLSDADMASFFQAPAVMGTAASAPVRHAPKDPFAAPANTLAAPMPAPIPPPIPSAKPAALSAAPAAGPGAGASTTDPKFATYARMQKMGLPEGAIRQKMTQNGLSDADMVSFFGDGSGGGVAPIIPPAVLPARPPVPAAITPALASVAGGACLEGGLLAQIQAGKNLKKASRRASAPPAQLAGLGGGTGGGAPGGLLSQIQGFKKVGLKNAEKGAATRRASMPGGGSKWDTVKSAVGGGGGMLQEIMKRQAQMKAIAERNTDKQGDDSDDDGW